MTPKYRAGFYRIDIVIDGHQVAIECDGDRYHTLDNLEDDMERQAVLQRMGWTFIRIRGSQFYRFPDGTMASVFERLQELDIQPHQEEEGSDAVPAEESELVDRVIRRAVEIRAGL